MSHFSNNAFFTSIWIFNVGIRAILEQILTKKLPLREDIFKDKELDPDLKNKLQKKFSLIDVPSNIRNRAIRKSADNHKLITERQCQLIFDVIDSGNLSAHELYNPDKADLNLFLSVIDDLFMTLFIQPFEKEKLDAKHNKNQQVKSPDVKNSPLKTDEDVEIKLPKKDETIH